jgi:hypothetical protein
VSAPSLRTQPVDRRRLSMVDRSSYRPNNRLGAIAKAKAFKSNWASQQQRKPFATEQKPGSGGFKLGSAAIYERQRVEGAKEARAESFRPENAISNDIYQQLAT